MLPVEQVIPFIRHEDPWVVDLAVQFLKRIRRPGRLSGDFVLEAVREGRTHLRRLLDDFQVSPAVLDYALEALLKSSAARDDFWARGVLAEAPDQLLTPEKAAKVRWLKFGRSWVGKRIQTKLFALSLSTEQLREQFVRLCDEADRKMSAMSEQHEIMALADSLAERHDVEWAMEKLGQSLGANNWIETWLFVILDKASHRPAFDLALGRFTETNPDENDALLSRLSAVICQLCEPADLDRVSSLWHRCAPDSRSYLIEEMGNLRFAEAEPFLLRITKAAADPFIRAIGATGLCEMLCTLDEATQYVGQLIESRDYDEGLVDLKDLAVPLGTIIRRPFAQHDRWRKHVAAEHARVSALQRTLGPNLFDWDDSGDDQAPTKPRGIHSEPTYEGPAEVLKLRSAETVGRNDPCPCGSGKKYKKCCLLNA